MLIVRRDKSYFAPIKTKKSFLWIKRKEFSLYPTTEVYDEITINTLVGMRSELIFEIIIKTKKLKKSYKNETYKSK